MLQKIVLVINKPERETRTLEKIRSAIQQISPHTEVHILEFCEPEFVPKVLEIAPSVIMTFPLTGQALPQGFYILKYLLNCRLVCFRTEGLLSNESQERINSMAGIGKYGANLVDYEIFWGPKPAELLGKVLLEQGKISSDDRIRFLGWPFLEDYFKPDSEFEGILPDKIKGKLNQYAREKSLLFVTGFSVGDYSPDDIINADDIVDTSKPTAQKFFEERIALCKKVKQFQQMWVETIIRNAENTPNLLFVVKMHPTEISCYKRKKFNPYSVFHNYNNILLIEEAIPFRAIISHCSILFHYGSTAMLESYLSKIPSVHVYARELKEICNDLSSSTISVEVHDMASVISHHVDSPLQFKQSHEVEKYLEDMVDLKKGQDYRPSERIADFLLSRVNDEPQQILPDDKYLVNAYEQSGSHNFINTLISKAVKSINEGDFQGALTIYLDKVVKLANITKIQIPDLQYLRSICLYKMGFIDRSIAVVNQELTFNPQNEQAKNLRSQLHSLSKKTKTVSVNDITDKFAPVEVSNLAGQTIIIDVKQDLIDFTRLPNETVHRLLKRIGYDARDEFADCVKKENSDHWFYMGSRYFIFENSIHRAQLEKTVTDMLLPGAKIWEFGGGTGNLSLALAFQGYDVSFTEVNSLQKDFLKFRADKYGIEINIIDPWRPKPKNTFDLVTALDVLEHIPDYHIILEELCDSVKPGGIIREFSAFLMDDTNISHRISDHHDYKKILTEKGFTRIYGVKAGKIWRKTCVCPEKHREKPQDQQILCPDFERFDTAFPDTHSNIKVSVRRNIIRAFEELTTANYPLVLDYLDDAYSLCPDATKKQCAHALKLLAENRKKELVATAQNALEKEPEHAVARLLFAGLNLGMYFERAMDSLRSGKASEALDNLVLIESFNSVFPDMHFAASVAYTQLGHLDLAQKACEIEIMLRPEHKNAKEFLRRIKEATNDANAYYQPNIHATTKNNLQKEKHNMSLRINKENISIKNNPGISPLDQKIANSHTSNTNCVLTNSDPVHKIEAEFYKGLEDHREKELLSPITVRNEKKSHYEKEYFNWQKDIGRFGGVANLFKFVEFIRPTDVVVDFGCGGGYLLKNINCGGKIGIEINKHAREEAFKQEIYVIDNITVLDDEVADVIISNHALEHVDCPLDVLRSLHSKLKLNGKIIFVVPHQDTREEYDSADKNNHLYTWNQMTLGNLFLRAGYKVLRSEAFQHQWPPNYADIYSQYGQEEFHKRCRNYAVKNNNYQIRVVATRDSILGVKA